LRSTSTGSPTGPGHKAEKLRTFRGSELYLLAALLVAILVAGGALALLYVNGDPGEGSAEAGFARDMAEHHAQAVQMAEISLRRTENEQVRVLATDILHTQQNQIGQMHGWLAAWGLPLTGSEPAMAWMGHPTDGLMPGMATPEEISTLETLPSEEADAQFLQLMIPHHEAAIPMAEAVLGETDRPEVEQLAGAIAVSQENEIRTMQAMLRQLGEEPPEDEPQQHTHADHG
jgi:uncharacterized protein (DUF305 family)